jgi:hypothetical protein
VELSVDEPLESTVGNDDEVGQPGHMFDDGFYQSTFDSLEGASEWGVDEENGDVQIVNLACPRPINGRRESVRSTFHGRRGSVVALDVLHRERNGTDSKDKEDIYSEFLSEALDGMDFPEGHGKRKGKGMVPSASCTQLQGQLGFEKTSSVSEIYHDHVALCQTSFSEHVAVPCNICACC